MLLPPTAHEGSMDSLDIQILAALQEDGRTSNVALARSLNLSPSAMLSRVRRLEQGGVIRGYRALIEPAEFGIEVQAILAVRLKGHNRTNIEEFERHIQHVDGIRACYHVTGSFDMVLHVAVPNLKALSNLTRIGIAEIPGVFNLETMLILANPVEDCGWPVPASTTKSVGRTARAHRPAPFVGA